MNDPVLVVDDEPDIREAIADFLQAAGYAVATAPNGKEALKIAASIRPCAILLDLMMPVMSGWDTLAAAIQRDEQLRSIPVIVMSAAMNPPAGATVIGKPFDPERLLAVLAGAAPGCG